MWLQLCHYILPLVYETFIHIEYIFPILTWRGMLDATHVYSNLLYRPLEDLLLDSLHGGFSHEDFDTLHIREHLLHVDEVVI